MPALQDVGADGRMKLTYQIRKQNKDKEVDAYGSKTLGKDAVEE